MPPEDPIVDWPPDCCVAAFFHAAVGKLGGALPDPRQLALLLETRVLKGRSNPWTLPETSEWKEVGVLPSTAIRVAPALLGAVLPGVGFLHVRLNTILPDMEVDVMREALARGCVVGLGMRLDDGDTRCPLRHLFRVHSLSGKQLSLIDDMSAMAVSCDIEAAMTKSFRAEGGLWIMGPQQSLQLPYTTVGSRDAF